MTRPEVEKAVEVRIDSSTGHAIFIYEEGAEELVQDIGGEIVKIDRASLVEWKQVGKDGDGLSGPLGARHTDCVDSVTESSRSTAKGLSPSSRPRRKHWPPKKKFFWKLLEPKARYGRVR